MGSTAENSQLSLCSFGTLRTRSSFQGGRNPPFSSPLSSYLQVRREREKVCGGGGRGNFSLMIHFPNVHMAAMGVSLGGTGNLSLRLLCSCWSQSWEANPGTRRWIGACQPVPSFTIRPNAPQALFCFPFWKL